MSLFGTKKKNGEDKKGLFKPLSGENLVEIVRKVSDSDLPETALMGMPEATVVTTIDAYYAYKINKPELTEKKIFDRVLKARMYSKEEIDNALDIELYKKANPNISWVHVIVRAVLLLENQSFDPEGIDGLNKKFKEERGIKETTEDE